MKDRLPAYGFVLIVGLILRMRSAIERQEKFNSCVINHEEHMDLTPVIGLVYRDRRTGNTYNIEDSYVYSVCKHNLR